MSTEVKKYTKVGIYARVSKQEQKTSDEQIRICEDYAALRGWTVVDIQSDVGSGAKDNRANRLEIIRKYRQRMINVVLVWRMDRWSRSLRDLIATLEDMQGHNTCFVSITEGLDLTSAAGRVIVHILGAFGQFERELIQERVKMGLEIAKSKGIKLGRPRIIEQSMRDEALDLFGRGWSKRAISQQLKTSRANVQRFIRAGLPSTKTG